MRYILSFIFLSIFGISVVQAAPQSSGKVERLYVRYDGYVLFKLGDSSNLPAECNDTNWPYQFNTSDAAGKEWYSMLLAYKTTGESLNIGFDPVAGSNRCNVVYLYN